MIKVKVITYGLPQHILESDDFLNGTKAKFIKVSRVPIVGEWLIWREQNFKITKVIHSPDTNTHAAVVEAQWSESV